MSGVNGVVEEVNDHEHDAFCDGLPDPIPFPQSRGLTVDQVIDALYHGPDSARFRLFFEYGHQEWKRYATDERAVSAVTELVLEGETPCGEDWSDFYRLIDDVWSETDEAYTDPAAVKRHVPVLISRAFEKQALPYVDDDDEAIDEVIRRVEEVADTDFVKLLIPLCGDDFETIDQVVKRSRMRSDRWSHQWVGQGHYYKRVINLAAVEWYREHLKQAEHSSGYATGYEFFRGHVLTAPAFVAQAPLHVDWFVDGYLTKGAITELDAKIKFGKTSLALDWSRAIASGEAQVMGRAVRKGRVLYLTEQGASFRSALSRSGAAECPDLHVLPREATWRMPWDQVVELAARYCKEYAIDVLVVDTLSKFAKIKDENDSVEAMRAMEPLQHAMTDLAILVLRHDRKSGGEVGDSARGSSAFGGEADIIIDMQKVSRDVGPATYRMLSSKGRYGEATPDELLVDFDGQGYGLVGDGSVAPRQTIYDRLKAAFDGNGHEHRKLRSDVLAAVRGQAAAKREALDKLIADGEVLIEGQGTRYDPFYVWLAPVAQVGQA